MKHSDAANILGINGDVTPEIVKQAYRLAAKKYHPDVNPAGEEMMKIINDAFDTLKDYTGSIEAGQGDSEYPEALNDALRAVVGLAGLHIEICGAWVWVSGDTYAYKALLKENGYRFASKKKAWHFRPDNWKSTSRGKSSMDDIRTKYGSSRPVMKEYSRLTCGGAV